MYSVTKEFCTGSQFSDPPPIPSPAETPREEPSSVPAEISPTEKATKKKFDEFMRVLARDENLKPLDPNDLVPYLLVEGIISDADYEKTETIKSISARKVVRMPKNNIE